MLTASGIAVRLAVAPGSWVGPAPIIHAGRSQTTMNAAARPAMIDFDMKRIEFLIFTERSNLG